MVRHIILWDFKDELSDMEKSEAAKKIKTQLEGLVGVVDGLQRVEVYTDMLGSSNADLMLDCTLEDETALKAYAVHPAHIAVKDFITTVVKNRKCVDFII